MILQFRIKINVYSKGNWDFLILKYSKELKNNSIYYSMWFLTATKQINLPEGLPNIKRCLTWIQSNSSTPVSIHQT